mmetsp:Transcript_32789/g.47462  ORF Transcript_32789/g.47462 Transcript_32789/m.47462 type:complete len:249 (+) Transcript_32789:299-1045(+)
MASLFACLSFVDLRASNFAFLSGIVLVKGILRKSLDNAVETEFTVAGATGAVIATVANLPASPTNDPSFRLALSTSFSDLLTLPVAVWSKGADAITTSTVSLPAVLSCAVDADNSEFCFANFLPAFANFAFLAFLLFRLGSPGFPRLDFFRFFFPVDTADTTCSSSSVSNVKSTTSTAVLAIASDKNTAQSFPSSSCGFLSVDTVDNDSSASSQLLSYISTKHSNRRTGDGFMRIASLIAFVIVAFGL